MRTGAIFARGSCRALKWMALFGVVFALGAGQALAQDAEVSIRLGTNKPAEGGALVPVTVTVDPSATATVPGSLTITLTLAPDPATDTTPPSDTRGELDATDADVAWEGVARGTAAVETLVFSWGDSRATDTETVNLRTYRDTDAEDEKFTITSTGGDTETDHGDPVKFTVIDAETQTFVLRHPFNSDGKIDEGMDPTLELEAVPLKTGPVTLRVTLDSENDGLEDYSLSTTTASISENFTIPVGADVDDANRPGVVNVPFVTEDTDGDRVDDTVTFEVTYASGDMRGDPAMDPYYTLTVVDLDKLPKITLTKIEVPDADDELQEMDYIPEGKIGTVTLTADRSPREVPSSEDIKIALRYSDASTADTRDYTISGSPVEMKGSATSGKFTVNVDADEDVGMESLVLEAMVEGTKANGPNPDDPYDLDPIAFSDQTDKQIEAKTYAEIKAATDAARAKGAGDNGLWEPGEMLTLMASDLFEYAETANVVLGNVDFEDPAVLGGATSNDMVTITAMGEGESPFSITGTVVSQSSSLEVTQTTSNVVTVKFPLMVDAPMITAKDNVQAVADAAVAKAAMESENGIWEPAPNGATAMIDLGDLFDVPASIEPRYLAESNSGNVDADVVTSTMMLELEPEMAGMDTITVTAVDTERPGNAVSVEFDVEVMEQASLRAKSQDDVDMVFMDAGAGMLVAGGDAIMVDMSMLYEIAEGVEPTYTATSSMPDVLAASTSGMMLTLTPMLGGDSMIMVEAVDSGSQSIVPVMYDASVAATAITYMLEGPEMADLVEGGMDHANGTPGSAMLTVTASAAVAADTEVMIMRDRSESTATDDDFMVEPLMIKAGEMMGTTMVTATADEMDERMEELVLYAMAGGMEVEGDVHLHIWDAAVPALPVIAQLLLAAFLAIGGYRRYLRR